MRPPRSSGSSAASLKDIRTSIKGEVVDIFTALLPPLQTRPPERAYEHIVENPEVLDGCFKIFRAKPHLFDHVLTDAKGQRVRDDNQRLRCGRSLSQIIPMIVRSSAKRYFRRVLPHDSGKRASAHPETTKGLNGILIRLGLKKAPKKGYSLSQADRHYRAVHNGILYEWQAGMLPHYAPLPAEFLAALGPHLADYRTPAELQALAEEFKTKGRLPAQPAAAQTLSAPTLPAESARAKPLKEEEVWALCQAAQLTRHLGISDDRTMRRLVAVACAASPDAVSLLRDTLGLKDYRLPALLCGCASVIGPSRFMDLFSISGHPAVLRRLQEHVLTAGLKASKTPKEAAALSLEIATSLATELLAGLK